MRDDTDLLQSLLTRDGRALRFASRRLRSDRSAEIENPTENFSGVDINFNDSEHVLQFLCLHLVFFGEGVWAPVVLQGHAFPKPYIHCPLLVDYAMELMVCEEKS